MLLVETYLKKVPVKGFGVFASVYIPKGTPVWRLDPRFDREITDSHLASMNEISRKFIHKYAYRDKHTHKWVLCADDARFINHSTKPNMRISGGEDVAARDIVADEELTCDYYDFDLEVDEKLTGVEVTS